MATKDEIVDCLDITLEDSLVGQLIADYEPSQNVVKEILRSA